MSDAIASADGGQGAAPAAPASSSSFLNVTPVTSETAATGSQLAAPVAPAAPAVAPKWLEGADETTIGYVQNKGWSEPRQVLDGYRNLEKLLGADKANNAVIIPKADADPKEWASVYDRLGRPSSPAGYNVAFPEGGDKTAQQALLTKAHELGLTKAQAEGLFGDMTQRASEFATQQANAKAEQFQKDDQAVRLEWGQAFTQNLALAQNAARGLGLDAETIDKMSDVLGHKGTMNLLQKIGSRMGEDAFVSGDGSTSFGSAMTPGQAKAQIQSLMADKDFTTKYLANNADAKAKMAELHRYAYPEG
jgi:hypothetical protein